MIPARIGGRDVSSAIAASSSGLTGPGAERAATARLVHAMGDAPSRG
jgi:hypothetical protein